MDFRKELEDIATVFDLQETALADSQAYVATLERKLAEAGVKPALPPPPPLKVFETYKEVVWERWPDTPETWNRPEFSQQAMQRQIYGPEKILPPIRNVIVKTYGTLNNVELRRVSGVQPDFEFICFRRCVDVTATYKAGIVQNGDDSFEADVNDIKFNCGNYQGGLNAPLSSWRSDFREYALILAAARPDLVLDSERDSGFFDLAPAP